MIQNLIRELLNNAGYTSYDIKDFEYSDWKNIYLFTLDNPSEIKYNHLSCGYSIEIHMDSQETISYQLFSQFKELINCHHFGE